MSNMSVDPTRLLVLGATRQEQPATGYAIMRELTSWGVQEWASVNPGSIYGALRALVKDGFVTEVTDPVAKGGRGHRDSTRFRLTAGLVLTLVVLARTQLTVTSWDLALPLLVWGLGIGLVIAPLFDFVLAALAENEVGSGSGVLNTLQQLGSAIGVAAIGTVFFAMPGYLAGFERSLQAGLGTTVALVALTFLLPRQARA
jgi:hypothetical protein